MIIVLKPNVSDESIKKIEDIIISKGVQPHVSKGEIQTIIGMVGDTTRIDPKIIEVEPEVEKVMKVSEPYKLANRAFHPDDTIVDVAGVKVGGDGDRNPCLDHLFSRRKGGSQIEGGGRQQAGDGAALCHRGDALVRADDQVLG